MTTHAPLAAGLGGLAAFLIASVAIMASVGLSFARLWRSIRVMFPREAPKKD